MITTNTILFAFALTIFAGLSTGIGSLFAFFTHRTNTKFLSIALGFSAGVMIYISFVEILADAHKFLTLELGDSTGSWVTVAAFFGGILIIAVIDKLVPSYDNPHEMHHVEELNQCEIMVNKNDLTVRNSQKLLRVGMFTAIAIVIHNLPEGVATFTSAIKNPSLGISIALAIAIHNIPEGIAVSIPIYCATGNRKKAFLLSFLSGLSEPVGAAIGYLILLPFLNEIVFGIIFAAVAGIMVFISLDELLPTAREYGEHHLSMYGLICGMAVMAVSLNLFM